MLKHVGSLICVAASSVLVGWSLTAESPSISAVSAQDEPSFAGDVMPMIRASCLGCHGADQPAAELDLSTYEGLMKGGLSGPAVVPGKPDESLFIQRMVDEEMGAIMPLGFPAIAAPKLEKIKAWIAAGATKGGSGDQHWAYVPPLRPSVPAVEDSSWPTNPIDNFILAQLEEKGIEPTEESGPAKLYRRLSLDITGLPPSTEELDAFLSDRSDKRWERAVDRLLMSPHYGERQALPWLDLARYADSNGHRHDGFRSIWPFRDYVINSFNEDKPFDEFTIEQIVGDLLPNPTQSQMVATGFHRNTMHNTEGGVDLKEDNWLNVVDRVSTTGIVWMATTLGCAQCHSHKFEPISHDEFFGFMAFFDNSEEPTLDLSTAQQKALRQELDNKIKATEAALKQVKNDSDDQKRIATELAELKADRNATIGPKTLVLKEREYEGDPTTIFREKGSYISLGKTVEAHVPEFLHEMPEGSPNNRLGFAGWLTSEQNPLTARVVVNRIWEQYFGRGIVKTSGDFGTQSEPPTHPELLDWLAVELMENGWSIKHIHRLIANSSTYRQSSRVSTEKRAADPDLSLYSRGPRFRLSAEAVRDNALSVSGLLNRTIGGPSVFPYQPEGLWDNPNHGEKWSTSRRRDERMRRGLYVFRKRTSPYPSFSAFDATSRETCTVSRYRTTTPLQALVTLNDPVYVEASRALGRKLSVYPGSIEEKIAYGFRRCTARVPSAPEVSLLKAHFDEQLMVRKDRPDQGDLGATAEEAAWTMLAAALLNLDETMTKE